MTEQTGKSRTRNLRQAAEKKIQKPSVTDEEIQSMDPAELRRMIHELRVHKVELEMQNETLRETQVELETARRRYLDLFDQAPVGYVSIDEKGIVRSTNQTAADLLATQPGNVIGKRFSTHVYPADRDRYFQFLNPLSDSKANAWEEVRLIQAGGSSFNARLQGKALTDGGNQSLEILLCLLDISEKKQAETELSKTRDQLRGLASYLQSVREEERAAIAREIHDELGQVMSYLKMGLSDIESRLPEADTETRQRIRKMKNALAETIKTTKSMITRLRPYTLDELGLVSALENYVHDFRKEAGIEADLFVNTSNLNLGEEKETAVFRIVQEALTNVARHSQAGHVVLNLSSNSQQVRLEISDDGIGIKELDFNSPQSCGLLGMRERAVALGGDVNIHSGPSRGTRLTAWIPV